MLKKTTITTFAIAILSLVPILLWLPYASFANPVSVLRGLGQVAALVGTVLFCINFVMATRWRLLEHLFFGLNRVYISHHLLGVYAFVLLLFHPMLLIASYLLNSLEAAFNLVMPSGENIAVTLGSLALASMSILLVLTIFIRPEYDRWKQTHTWLGFSLLLASLHGFLIGSTLASSLPLKFYIFGFFSLALISFVYRLLSKIRTGNKFRYIVERMSAQAGTIELVLKAEDKQMDYVPGQFAFLEISHPGVAKQSHPFSMTSIASQPQLSFGIKSLGDYTETLRLVEPETEVWVEGPYGRFSYQYHQNLKQVWIGGGIGITPFMSMLKSLPDDPKYSVMLLYAVRDEKEAVFDSQIKQIEANKSQVTYRLWLSSIAGRLSGQAVADLVSDLEERDVYLCCPPAMLHSLKRQLLRLGIIASNIHTEEFELA